MSNIKTAVLNTVAANSGDLTISAGKVSLVSCFTNIDYQESTLNAPVVAAAEVSAVASLAYTYAASTNYTFTAQQWIPEDNAYLSRTFNYTTPASGASNATMATLIKAWFTNNGFLGAGAGAGTPVTFTAAAGYPLLLVQSGNNVTVTMTTAGVEAVGTSTSLVNNFGVDASLLTTGNYYDRYEVVVPTLTGNGGGFGNTTQSQVIYCFVNIGADATADANAALLRIGWNNIRLGLTVNGGVVHAAADATVTFGAIDNILGMNLINKMPYTLA